MINEAVWKIKEFVEKVNAMHIAKYPDDTEVHRNTIDNWFKDLESKGIHYVQRSPLREDWKIYDEVDLNIGLFIMEMRSKMKGQGWQVSAIYNVIPNECNVRPFPENYESLTPALAMEQLVEELKKDVQNHIESSVKMVVQEAEKQRRLLLETDLKTSEERMKETTKQAMVSLFNRQQKLKTKAAAEWEKLPEEERFIKRLFRKEENLKKRQDFIEDYVEKNMWKGFALGSTEDNVEND